MMRNESVKIIRKNDNLDLSSYKPFIHDFHRYSGHLFENDQNIFKEQPRASSNEANNKKQDPDHVDNALKPFPPSQSETIPSE